MPRLKPLGIAILGAATFVVAEPQAPLRLGTAVVDITPPLDTIPTALGGYGARKSKPATGVHDPVYARALILTDGVTKLALVATDLLDIPGTLKQEVLKNVKGETGITSSRLLLWGSHTHCGPDPFSMDSRNVFQNPTIGVYNPKLRDHVAAKIAEAINAAARDFVPVVPAAASKRLPGLNRNRRGDRTTDDTLTVLRFNDLLGKTRAVLVNYTAHPTIHGADTMEITAGWPGSLARKLGEDLAGAVVLYANGAQGDQSPVASGGGDAFDRARRYGENLAGEALALVRAAPSEPEASFAGGTERIALPPRVVHPAFKERAGREYLVPEIILTALLNALFPSDVEIAAMRIGSVAIVSAPGELLALLGLEIKGTVRRLGCAQPILIGLANEYIGYILSSAEYDEGGYEATVSFYGPTLGHTLVGSIAGVARRQLLGGATVATASRASDRKIPGFQRGPRRNDIVPGRFMIDPPTLENLGFRWYIESDSDSNRNATVAVSYRKKGSASWKTALPMLRVHHEVANRDYGPYRTGNLFAGSVLFLEPATEYEVTFVMRDPDGGAPPPRTVTVATRAEPVAFQKGRSLHVYPRGSTATRQAGSFEGLALALKAAKPGTTLLLHTGIYRGAFRFRLKGEPGNPIVLRGETDGTTIIEGPDRKTHLLDIDGSAHLTFEHLTFRRAAIAIRAGKKRSPGVTELVVRRCTFEDVITGILTYSENATNWYIADNTLTGMNPTWYPRPPKTYMSPSHTGINLYGRGHVVCYNRVSRFSDSLAIANYGPPVKDVEKHCVAIDFYNNDLSFAQDDGIEADYGCHNVRIYRNRITNAHTGLSAQPFYGGPCYFIRNATYSLTALPLKLHNYCTGLEIYHNTCVSARQGFQSFYMWQNAILRNNLFMGGTKYAMETGSPTPSTTLDYNGYRRNEPERFLKWFDGNGWGRYQSLEAFFRATGHEQHGLQVDYDIFVNALTPAEGTTHEPGEADLRLRPGSAAVDAGQVLPTVNNGFAGRAPDLGCYERGKPLPHYGPRR